MQEINKMYCENCLETMVKMADNSVDSIVTDPPYGLKFMGKKWDCEVPGVAIWEEALRVLKPGGHLLAFAGTRTQHRMAVNIEDAGFEIRDLISWVYGSGFPKSHDISKAIDRAAGVERKVSGFSKSGSRKISSWQPDGDGSGVYAPNEGHEQKAIPATFEPQMWQGWGTALKPAFEPITVARKPIQTTVAANVLQYGTGGINIDGCRIGGNGGCKIADGDGGFDAGTVNSLGGHLNSARSGAVEGLGRFPANFIHDGSEEVMVLFPETASGASKPEYIQKASENTCMSGGNYERPMDLRDKNSGSAARFFYTAKASKSERGKGNDHPTVKPLDLMRYLVRLVTPPKGLVYDPFAGSGTTLIAAIEEGFSAIGSDLDQHHCDIFNLRTRHGIQPKMF